jgi:GTP-binding protein
MPETQANLPRLRKYFRGKDMDFYEISAIGMLGTEALMKRVAAKLAEIPPAVSLMTLESAETPVLKPATLDQDAFQVQKLEEGAYRVRGKRIERVIAMTDLENEEALERLQVVFDRTGISRALEKAGVKGGDMVQFGRVELEWQEQW